MPGFRLDDRPLRLFRVQQGCGSPKLCPKAYLRSRNIWARLRTVRHDLNEWRPASCQSQNFTDHASNHIAGTSRDRLGKFYRRVYSPTLQPAMQIRLSALRQPPEAASTKDVVITFSAMPRPWPRKQSHNSWSWSSVSRCRKQMNAKFQQDVAMMEKVCGDGPERFRNRKRIGNLT